MEKLNIKKIVAGMDVNTVSIVDARPINEHVGMVTAQLTGQPRKADLLAKIQAKLNGSVSPVAGSFRFLDDEKQTVIGFVRNKPEVVPVDDDTLKASYRCVSNNMYMDDNNEGWQLTETASGKMLTRIGEEELPTVLSRAINRRSVSSTNSGLLANLDTVRTPLNQFVAYVTQFGDLEYGVTVGRHKSTDSLIVKPFGQDRSVSAVNDEMVVEAYSIQVRPEVHDKITAGMKDRATAGLPDAQKVVDYWNQVFFYDPEYMNQFIRIIEERAAA